jgi:SAM-dependent methyltransferase
MTDRHKLGRPSDAVRVSNHTYERLYAEGSSRLANEGEIGITYRIPKMFTLLRNRCLRERRPLTVLEIGAGVGEVASLFKLEDVPLTRYVGSEYSAQAAQRMHREGLLSVRTSAEHLPFRDNSFDLVFCFDVMHHVSDPRAMAEEMVRVTRRHFFLSEANGLSPVRKLGERSARAKSLGEQSYLPWTYRRFFPRSLIESIELYPFYVLVPPHTPHRWIPLIKTISEIGERIPLLRWVGGQSLMIAGRKRTS